MFNFSYKKSIYFLYLISISFIFQHNFRPTPTPQPVHDTNYYEHINNEQNNLKRVRILHSMYCSVL